MYFESFDIENILKSPFLYQVMTQVMKARDKRCNEIGLGLDCLTIKDIGYCKSDFNSLESPGIYISYTKNPKFQYLEKVLVRASFLENDIKNIVGLPLNIIRDKTNVVILHTTPNF